MLCKNVYFFNEKNYEGNVNKKFTNTVTYKGMKLNKKLVYLKIVKNKYKNCCP